jgi:hypothetical protein
MGGMAGLVGVGLAATQSGNAQGNAAEPVSGRLELAAYPFSRQVWVRHGPDVITCYRANPTQKYPYFYPVIGPASGLPLTTESGDPYPHHRSLLFACDHVNQGNYWQEGIERGQIVSRGPQVVEGSGERTVIADACDWRIPGAEPDLTDERRFTISAPSPTLRLIEAEITVTAAVDVHISRTNHSLFALRAAPDLAPKWGGNLVNSEGQTTEKGTFGQVARWCTYYAERFGVTEGIALMDHPGNPWSPCKWFTRDYGFISPTPMQWLDDEGLDLPQGESWHLRYLVVGYTGTPEEAGLDAICDSWQEGSDT